MPPAGDPNSLRSGGDATARVSAAKAPRERSLTRRPDGYYAVHVAKLNRTANENLDYVRE